MTIEIRDLNLPPKQRRDAAYLRGRIRKSDPAIYERLQQGEIRSVNEAARMAGIIKPDTPLKKLRRAWKKVSREDRERFVQEQIELGAGSLEPGKCAAPAIGSVKALTGPDGKLTASAIGRLWEVMISRGIRPADVMEELGRSRYGYRFQEALSRSKSPSPELIENLAIWLEKH